MKSIGALLVLIGGLFIAIIPTIMFFYGIVLMVVDSFFYGLFAAIAYPIAACIAGAVLVGVGSVMDGA